MAESIKKQCHDCWMQGEGLTARDLLNQVLAEHSDIDQQEGENLWGSLLSEDPLTSEEMCGFSLIANVIAANLNLDPADKSILIAKMRIDARNNKLCPNINNVDPPYPGKNLL